jgi:cytochrome c
MGLILQFWIRVAGLIGAIAAAGTFSVLMSSAAFAPGIPPAHSVLKTAVTPQGRADAYSAVAVYGRGTFAFPLYGRGLPMGGGNAADGARVFATICSGCHSLRDGTTPAAEMTGCWRYTKPLFNFVKRAMPTNAPGSLSDDDIYAVLAYLLSDAKIIRRNEIMNERTLPRVTMPHRDGFIPQFCPELSLYR